MTLDEPLVRTLRTDWQSAPPELIDAPDRAMLAYAEKLTRHPAAIQPNDLDPLRAAGFNDTAILQINLIASFFNYINRVADGLGVGRGDEASPTRA